MHGSLLPGCAGCFMLCWHQGWHAKTQGASWFHNRPHYLTEQREINAKMRAILVDWLVEARWLQDEGCCRLSC